MKEKKERKKEKITQLRKATTSSLHKERENLRCTDEQYALYCIEIPNQKLVLDWYWLNLQSSAIPLQILVKIKFMSSFI